MKKERKGIKGKRGCDEGERREGEKGGQIARTYFLLLLLVCKEEKKVCVIFIPYVL